MKLLQVLEQRALNKEASKLKALASSKSNIKRMAEEILKFLDGPGKVPYSYEIDSNKLKTLLNASKAWVRNHPKTTVSAGTVATAGTLAGLKNLLEDEESVN